jgi:glycosyltransferase involved in cell wall biosynthesis
MNNSKHIIIVMPAFNAAKTLHRIYNEIPSQFRNDIILVDDCSLDQTVEIDRDLGIKVICHTKNLGYGGNQKTCYTQALRDGADIVVMVHHKSRALNLGDDLGYGESLAGAGGTQQHQVLISPVEAIDDLPHGFRLVSRRQ